jgi:hypothetical protein
MSARFMGFQLTFIAIIFAGALAQTNYVQLSGFTAALQCSRARP